MATLVESAAVMETLTLGTSNSSSAASNAMASPTSVSLSQHFVDSKFYLLVVIGEIVTEEHLKCAIADIEKGRRRRCIQAGLDGGVVVVVLLRSKERGTVIINQCSRQQAQNNSRFTIACAIYGV